MSLQSNELTPVQALDAAIQTSLALQTSLKELSQLDNDTDPAEDEDLLENMEALAAKRDQLIRQTFAQQWQEAEVKQYQQQLNQLENLNTQLTQQLEDIRSSLFQQRVDNQQGRKAVSAYGNAKNQWQG